MSKLNLEPNYEEALALFGHMSDENLMEFINSDEKVEEIVKGCEQCKELETEKELIMAQNKSLAEYNLSLSPKLESGKSKLKELCDSVHEVRESVQAKLSQLKDHAGNLNSDTVLALLQTAAAESEEESEKIVEKLYQKEIEMDEFLDQFQAHRKLMHLRRVKADKMNEILTKNDVYGPRQKKKPAPPIPYPTVPYPVGGFNMPHFPMAK